MAHPNLEQPIICIMSQKSTIEVEKYTKQIDYLKNNLTNWKASYEGCQLVEATTKVSNLLEKDVSVFYRHFQQVQPKAAVFIFHGLTESSLFYGGLASQMQAINYEVFAADHQGSGFRPRRLCSDR